VQGNFKALKKMPTEIRRLQTIAFFDTVPGSSAKTLCSKRIEVPFKIKSIRAAFAPGVNRLMNLEFYVSPDDSTPTKKPLTGINILESLGHVGYITGDDEWEEHPVEVEEKSAGAYVKVFADNRDVYEHTIDAQVLIELYYLESTESS
jgi:hypothetical protein